MKKMIYLATLLFLSIIDGYLSYIFLEGIWLLFGIFSSGLCLGIFLMGLVLNLKNNSLNSYKRELEKESIISDENSAKVKVLEAKIDVLEKALEKSLKKQ